MTYPEPAKRKYKNIAPYRDYFIGVYIDTTKPLNEVGAPCYQLFFPIDDMGDCILPLDYGFWSPVLAAAAIDMHVMLGADRTVYGRTGGPWNVMHQNYRMQRFLPGIAQTLREVHLLVTDPKLDMRYMDPEELADAIKEKLAPIWRELDGAGPIREGLGKLEFDGSPAG